MGETDHYMVYLPKDRQGTGREVEKKDWEDRMAAAGCAEYRSLIQSCGDVSARSDTSYI